LSLQLGFAIIPLIHFVSDKTKMKGFHISKTTQVASWIIATIIVSLNAKLVFDEIDGWLETSENSILLWVTVVPIAIAFLGLLLYIIFEPFVAKGKTEIANHSPHTLILKIEEYRNYKKKNIAISVDFSAADEEAILHALDLGGKEANYTLIHVVETVGAMLYGNKVRDHETTIDEKLLLDYHRMIEEKGFKVETKLGFGKPGKIIPKIINEGNYHLLIMGTHGHTGLKDLIFGTTVDNVRHQITIPLFLVKN
jgi:manganese transport protein